MTLVYSAILCIKFQGKFIRMFTHFVEDKNTRCTPIPAFVKARGRANRKLRNRRQQDHENTTFIHKNGDVPLLERTIETPNVKTIQRGVQS